MVLRLNPEPSPSLPRSENKGRSGALFIIPLSCWAGVYTLQQPVELCCRVAHCSNPACPSHPHTLSPAGELARTLPGWLIGWGDVFCFIGHRKPGRSLSKLKSPNLEKALTCLDDRLIEPTSNAVERTNRRFRKAQQSIYSVRSKEHLEERLALAR